LLSDPILISSKGLAANWVLIDVIVMSGVKSSPLALSLWSSRRTVTFLCRPFSSSPPMRAIFNAADLSDNSPGSPMSLPVKMTFTISGRSSTVFARASAPSSVILLFARLISLMVGHRCRLFANISHPLSEISLSAKLSQIKGIHSIMYEKCMTPEFFS